MKETIWRKIGDHAGRPSAENEKVHIEEALQPNELRSLKADVLVIGDSIQGEQTDSGFLDRNDNRQQESGSEEALQSPIMAPVPKPRTAYFDEEHDTKSGVFCLCVGLFINVDSKLLYYKK